jgi:ferredoxin
MSNLYTIEMIGSEKTFVCRSDETIMAAAERHNILQLKVGCRGGGCGVCKIKIISGSYEMGRMSKAHCNEQQKTEGIVLACRVKPTSDIQFIFPVPVHPSL